MQAPVDETAIDAGLIRALLDEADDETRQCIVYTYFDDCTREETAELVGLSVPTVRKRINTFLDRARRQLGAPAAALLLALAPLLDTWRPS